MIHSQSVGKRLISLAICLIGVFCLLQPAKASDAQQAHTTLTSIVRRSAYHNATPIGQLENGTAVTVLGETREFYKIDCYDMNGYIAKEQLACQEDGKYYVNCAGESTETQTFTYEDHAQALQLRHSLIDLAREQLGKPYIYGSTGPRGFDCSGLMQFLFSSHDIALHRTASQQLQDGIIVSKENMQVGDLVFFRESWDSYPASHVGIYIGNDQFIHAANGGMMIDDLYSRHYGARFLCARRIVETETAQLELVATAVTSTAAAGRRIN